MPDYKNVSKTLTPVTTRQNDSLLSRTKTTNPFPLNLSYQSNLTIVTAFFKIGKFVKSNSSDTLGRSQRTYMRWARMLKYMLNPLVVYTDSKKFFNLMETLRVNLAATTKIFMIDRNSSWAFEIKDKIKDIYNQKGYPKYNPGTVIPDYSCVMHFKYDAMWRASTENYFHTRYFAWLDIGLFRRNQNRKDYFMLVLPPDFNHSRVAVSKVYTQSMDTEIPVIIKQKLDWVCGCIFVGERRVIIQYAEQYKRAVEYLLTQNLMNSDQQVIYAMYSVTGRKYIKPEIDLQFYQRPNITYNRWFYLGYLMRKFVE